MGDRWEPRRRKEVPGGREVENERVVPNATNQPRKVAEARDERERERRGMKEQRARQRHSTQAAKISPVPPPPHLHLTKEQADRRRLERTYGSVRETASDYFMLRESPRTLAWRARALRVKPPPGAANGRRRRCSLSVEGAVGGHVWFWEVLIVVPKLFLLGALAN